MQPSSELVGDPHRSLALWRGRGKLHGGDQDARHRRRTRFLLPQIRPVPSSETQRREAGLTAVLNTFTLDLTPLIFLPQRLGRSRLLDTATDALIRFPEELALDSTMLSLRSDAFKSYSKALRLVHQSLEQLASGKSQSSETFDDLIGAIMALSFVDVISVHVGWSKASFGSFTHWNGVTSLLLSSPTSSINSDIARSSLDHGFLCSNIIPVFLGRPSPFEGRGWLEAEPASIRTQPSELRQLFRTTRQLMIRLPRLICQIRELRSNLDATTLKKTFQLAIQLLQLQDEAAEDWLLHHVSVKPTAVDGQTKSLIPYSYMFRSCNEMEAGLTYWHGRLTVLQLYSTLLELRSLSMGQHESRDCNLTKEKQRAITNILMSWPYGKLSGYAATAQFNTPLIGVWAAVRQQDNFRGHDIATVSDWIMETLRECYCGWIMGKTRDDLNAAANVLMGGPLEGPFVELMRSSILPSHRQEPSAGVG